MFLVHEAQSSSSAASCPISQKEAALIINAELDRAHAVRRINEPCLERVLCRIEADLDQSSCLQQLLTARLLEAAMLCAGQYADHAEYSLVGDLMINPREIHVHFADGSWTVKNRHDRLSDQFNTDGREHFEFMTRFKKEACLNTVRQPLIPLLFSRIRNAEVLTPEYTKSVTSRMEHLGKTMNFLWTWGVDGAEDLFHLQVQASRDEWGLVEKNLCRFTSEFFHDLGDIIGRLCRDADQSGPPAGSRQLGQKHTSPQRRMTS